MAAFKLPFHHPALIFVGTFNVIKIFKQDSFRPRVKYQLETKKHLLLLCGLVGLKL